MSDALALPTPHRLGSPLHAPRSAFVCAALLASVLLAPLGAQTSRAGESVRPVYPGTRWESATPESQGLDGRILATQIAALPAPANLGPLMVVANGYVVHSVGAVNRPEDLFSCSKAITAMIAAKLVRDGRIRDLDTAIPNSVPGAWPSYPGDATLRMFLSMTSDYGLPGPRSPGLRHAYNNHAVDFLGEYLSRSFYGLGPDRMHTVVQRALTVDIGRQDSITFTGQWGGWFGGLRMSCRDLARFGLLLMRDGVWNGRRILDEEFTRGIWRRQIPATSQRYTSGSPNENSMWNQQAVTDLLDDQWSFGLWRVGDIRVGGTWDAAAMDGYRGKRVVLCPRGTLPNPELELMLVCLPQLANEGPASSDYRDAMLRAVIRPERHPDHDPRCMTATFDDGTLGPLESRLGGQSFSGGDLRLDSPSRCVLPGATLTDASVVFSLPAGVPSASTIGIVLRAASPSDDAFASTGTQTFAGLKHDAAGRLRVTVGHPLAGAMTWADSPPLGRSTPAGPLTVRIDVAGDRLRARVNGEDAFGPTGIAGIPAPARGGFFGIRSTGHTTPIDVGYVLMRPADGPVGEVTTDSVGNHTLALLAPDHLGDLPWSTFHVLYDDLVIDASALPVIVPFVWPTVVAFGTDHLILSSSRAPVGLASGKQLVIQMDGIREGELLR